MTDWGSVADWVAAIGTVGTLGIAVLVLWRDQQSRLLSQGMDVSIWMTSGKDFGEVGEFDCKMYWKTTVHLVNTSARPIHSIFLTYQVMTFEEAEVYAEGNDSVDGPTSSVGWGPYSDDVTTGWSRLADAGARLDVGQAIEHVEATKWAGQFRRYAIEFSDSNGYFWVHDLNTGERKRKARQLEH